LILNQGRIWQYRFDGYEGGGMKPYRIILISILAFSLSASAMDGIAITIVRASKYSWTGKLLRYDIVNNKVAAPNVLYEGDVYNPSINMSGTYVAFLQNKDSNPWISVIGINGGNVKDIIQVNSCGRSQGLWWLESGDFFVQGPVKEIHKVSLSASNGALKATKSLRAKLQYAPQGDYIDMDLKGKLINMRIYDGVSNSLIDELPPVGGTVTLAGAALTGIGCGNGVAPAANYFCNYQNSGHSSIPVRRFPGGASAGGVSMKDFTTSAWQHESGINYGKGGVANGWSVNSYQWIVSELGCDGRFTREGSDQHLINWVDKIVINTSRTCNESGKKYGARGDLWISSKADVDDEFWKYVENRNERNEYWSDLLGLDAVSAAHTPSLANGYQPEIRRQGALLIYDISGKFCGIIDDAQSIGNITLSRGTYVLRHAATHAVVKKVFIAGR
jgi:hypothetical protein